VLKLHKITAAFVIWMSTLAPALAAETNRETRAELIAGAKADAGPETELDREFKRLLAQDDTAQEEAARLTEEASHPTDLAVAPSSAALGRQISERMKTVRDDYESFLKRHPDHARAHLAFGSFLNDLGDEKNAIDHYEISRRLDPKNPAVWNNLAGAYAHFGPVTNSFPYYEEAIRLNPNESTYYHNFGTLVFLFRRDATNYFKCTETEVFDKALALYRKGLELEPDDFNLAADYAQTYYGIFPARNLSTDAAKTVQARLGTQALSAWTNAIRLAPDIAARQGVLIHFARWNIKLGRIDDARTNLADVNLPELVDLRERVAKSIPGFTAATNAAATSTPTNPVKAN
jgi:tetratricopeptide (TPR) repeat protein